MHPILFELGDFAVGTYALFALLGLIAGVFLFSWLGRREGHDRWVFVEMGLWAFIIAIATSKLFGIGVDLVRGEEVSLREALRFAGHYWAGFLAGSTYLLLDFRRRGIGIGSGLDALAPALALAHGLGRLGCFFGGCCWGAACEAPWAVTFPPNPNTGIPAGVPLHPTQLYEAALELVLCAALLVTHVRWRRFAGQTFLHYVLVYGVARFFLEEVRADASRGGVDDVLARLGLIAPGESVIALSTTQALLVPTVAAAVVAYVVLLRRGGGGAPPGRETETPKPAGRKGGGRGSRMSRKARKAKARQAEGRRA